jgi:hypothetical protein
MSKIILQPSGNKDARDHYNDTIKNKVKLNDIQHLISNELYETLLNIYPEKEFSIWGVTPGGNNITKWNRIDNGDVTLFSKSGGIFASAVTTFKTHNPVLAAKLWGYDKKGQTWEYIYFLDEIKSHSIPYIEFNRAVGYAENYIIQGFNVLRKDQSKNVLKSFDLESDTYFENVSDQDYESILNKLKELENTEAEIISTRRLEQGYLKKHLFGTKTYGNCACCKNRFPISFLVTAHIKKREFCNTEERKDINVVFPMCKLGCDEVYEKGYLSVMEGLFVTTDKTPSSPVLQSYLTKLNNEPCKYFNSYSKKYFEWHFQHHQMQQSKLQESLN